MPPTHLDSLLKWYRCHPERIREEHLALQLQLPQFSPPLQERLQSILSAALKGTFPPPVPRAAPDTSQTDRVGGVFAVGLPDKRSSLPIQVRVELFPFSNEKNAVVLAFPYVWHWSLQDRQDLEQAVRAGLRLADVSLDSVLPVAYLCSWWPETKDIDLFDHKLSVECAVSLQVSLALAAYGTASQQTCPESFFFTGTLLNDKEIGNVGEVATKSRFLEQSEFATSTLVIPQANQEAIPAALQTRVTKALYLSDVMHILGWRLPQERKLPPKREPFRPLIPFTEEEEGYFFGRDRFLADMLGMDEPEQKGWLMGQHRHHILMGPSGVGKSSFLQAGVVARLRKQGHKVFYVDCRKPNLYQQLWDFLKRKTTTSISNSTSLLELVRLITKVPPSSKEVVLLLDQFESLWLDTALKSQFEQIERDLRELVEASKNDPSLRYRVVLGLRDDCLSQLCQPFAWYEDQQEPLVRWFTPLTQQFHTLNLLTKEEAHNVVLQSLSCAPSNSPQFEEDALSELLRDLEHQLPRSSGSETRPVRELVGKIYPPYFQIVCNELFVRAKDSRLQNISLHFYRQQGALQNYLKDYLERSLGSNPHWVGDGEVSKLPETLKPVARSALQLLAIQSSQQSNLPEKQLVNSLLRRGYTDPQIRQTLNILSDRRLLIGFRTHEKDAQTACWGLSHDFLRELIRQQMKKEPHTAALLHAQTILQTVVLPEVEKTQPIKSSWLGEDMAQLLDPHIEELTHIAFDEPSEVRTDIEHTYKTAAQLIRKSLRYHRVRSRLLFWLPAAFLVVTGVLGWGTYRQYAQAVLEQRKANLATQRAEREQIEARSQRQRAEQAAEQAASAEQRTWQAQHLTKQAEQQRVLAEQRKQSAEQRKTIAEQAARIAQRREEKARKQTEQARQAQKKAELAQVQAEQQRVLAEQRRTIAEQDARIAQRHVEKARKQTEQAHQAQKTAELAQVQAEQRIRAMENDLQRLEFRKALARDGVGVTYLKYHYNLHDRTEQIQQAVILFKKNLEFFGKNKKQYRVELGNTHNRLGVAYYSLPTGDRTRNLHKAVAHYKLALHYTPKLHPEKRAMIYYNLGNAYANLPGENKNGIAAYKLALQVYTPKSHPEKWAATMHAVVILHERSGNLEEANKVCKRLDNFWKNKNNPKKRPRCPRLTLTHQTPLKIPQIRTNQPPPRRRCEIHPLFYRWCP